MKRSHQREGENPGENKWDVIYFYSIEDIARKGIGIFDMLDSSRVDEIYRNHSDKFCKYFFEKIVPPRSFKI